MDRCHFAFILVFALLTACNLTPTPTSTSTSWQSTVDAMAALTQDLQIPEHLRETDAARTGKEFDVNEYFSVLNHLSLQPGYVLDYVYRYEQMGGEPIVYARREDERPYSTSSEYAEAMGEGAFASSRYEYLDHIQVDDTAEGFFEFIVLYIMGDQFYLYWHANYNDTRIVCDRAGLEVVIAATEEFGTPLSSEVQREARALDLEPRVQFEEGTLAGERLHAVVAQEQRLDLEPRVESEEGTVHVRVVTFTKWGGFFEETYTISRDFPHTILHHEADMLVAYDCGVSF